MDLLTGKNRKACAAVLQTECQVAEYPNINQLSNPPMKLLIRFEQNHDHYVHESSQILRDPCSGCLGPPFRRQDIRLVRALLDREDRGTTQVYTKVTDARLANAVAALPSFQRPLIEPASVPAHEAANWLNDLPVSGYAVRPFNRSTVQGFDQRGPTPSTDRRELLVGERVDRPSPVRA